MGEQGDRIQPGGENKMELPYENPKWEKLRREISEIGYHFEAVPPMDGYIKMLRKTGMQKADYAHYFACLSVNYHSWVRDRYLMDPGDPLLADDIYRSGLAGVLSQRLGGPGLPQWEKEFSLALYELAALDCVGIDELAEKESVLGCMLMKDYETAERLLSAIEADDEPRIGSQYIELKYLKNLYLSILRGDEAAFNSEIIRRVKMYRGNPYTHGVVIDFPAVALVKIAGRNGISYLENMAEIPRAMVTGQLAPSPDCPMPPLVDEAARLFGISVPR